jgi:recombination protein RecA
MSEAKKPTKQDAIREAVAGIEKTYGQGAIMRLGERAVEPVAVIPTGSLAIDEALGVGGFPRGRIVEIFGPESSGKTTLTLHAIAETQAAGGVAAFIDAEHAFDLRYARGIGIDLKKLLVAQPDCGEQALEIAEALTRSGAVDLIVIDSVAALVPKAEIEGDMGDSHVGLQARLMSQALRKVTGSVNRSHCMIFFTNQIRMKIGVMFGSPETTTGGNALKFYASVRLDVRRIGAIKEAGPPGKDMVVVGNRTRVKVVKNKMAPPFREVEFDILYGQGISRSGEVVDMGSDANIIQKSGAWFSLDGERIGQGRDNARTYLEQHPALMEKVVSKVMEHNGLKRGGPAGDVAAKMTPGVADPKPSAGQGKSGKGEAGAEPAQADAKADVKSPNGSSPNGAKRPPNARPS